MEATPLRRGAAVEIGNFRSQPCLLNAGHSPLGPLGFMGSANLTARIILFYSEAVLSCHHSFKEGNGFCGKASSGVSESRHEVCPPNATGRPAWQVRFFASEDRFRSVTHYEDPLAEKAVSFPAHCGGNGLLPVPPRTTSDLA